MAERPRLALAIPTYRRAQVVAENLAAVIGEARALGVPIYFSDDSPDADTPAAIADVAPDGTDIHYRRNDPALGHDANLLATLVWPDADYVWLLGDSLRIRPGRLARILDFLDDQDLLFVRHHADDARMIAAIHGEEALSFIREKLWHQTMTGATIYHRRVCDFARPHEAALSIKRNFPQLSVILAYATANRVTVGWFGDVCADAAKKQSYWSDRAVSVFVDDWAALVTGYPAVIPLGFHSRVIRSHSANTGLFGQHLLLSLKRSDQFAWSSLRRPYFRDAMHLPTWRIVLLLALPAGAVAIGRRIKGGVRYLARRLRRVA